MDKEVEPKLIFKKSSKGKIFRNIWLICIVIFVVSIVGMLISVITDKSGSYVGVGTFTLILTVSGAIGSIFFLVWIFKIGNKFIKTVILILVGLFIFLILVKSVVRYAIVDGKSMEPSFKNNEIFLVNKLSYKTVSPKRGDVVSYTLGEGFGEYMGRIVGLPNEIIIIKQGEVRVDGNKLDEPYADWDEWSVGEKQVTLNKNEYLILYDKRNKPLLSTNGELIQIESKNIIGKFTFKIWSLN